jgi:hypothetical protein
MVPAGGKYGTALQAASFQGKLEIVGLLLDRGADPNVQGMSFAISTMYDRRGTCRRRVRDCTPSSVVPGKAGNCHVTS